MTFDEARQKQLEKLDTAHAKLRAIIEDKNLTNDEFKPLKDAVIKYIAAVTSMIKLNQAEQEFKIE